MFRPLLAAGLLAACAWPGLAAPIPKPDGTEVDKLLARVLSLKPDLKPFEIKTILYWLFQAGAKSG